MAQLGIISLQSNTKKDVFYSGYVLSDDSADESGGIANAEEAGFDTTKPWINGGKPKAVEVNIEGDGCRIYGWFKGTKFPAPFIITVYIEYEEKEELLEKLTAEQ